jgi:hypothetical protein
MRFALSLLMVLAIASIASAAALDRSVESAGRVSALARSGYQVAWVSAQVGQADCAHVELWNLVNKGHYRLQKKGEGLCSEGPSTGAGVVDVAIAGSRAAWLEYAGGNLRDWLLMTATRTAPKHRELEFEEVDVDEPSPIVLGVASEQVIPYSVRDTVKALQENGKRAYSWKAPALVTNTTAYGRQVAVFVRGGKCYLLSPAGAVQRVYTFPVGAVQEFALGRIGLLVQLHAGKVQIWNAAGVKVRELTLPAGARMRDFQEGILLYSLNGQIRGRKIVSGKDALVRTAGAQAPLAQLENTGLTYAVGRKVYSVAMVNVQAAFR